MSRNVIISGDFDCINSRHLHLIKEAKKQAIPNGRVVILLFADYTKFLLDKIFPIQTVGLRKKNLEYFIKSVDIVDVDTSDYEGFLDNKLNSFKDFLYIHYETDKEFVGRSAMKKHGIQVKFIKEPKI